MIDWLYILLDLAATCVRVVLGFFLIGMLLKVEPPNRRPRKIIMAGTAIAIIVTASAGSPIPAFWVMVIEIGAMAFLACRFFKQEIRLCIFISFFYETAIAFWEFLISSGIQIVLFPAYPKVDDLFIHAMTVWIVRLFMFGTAFFARKKKNIDGKIGYRYMSTISLLGFFSLIALSRQKVIFIEEDTLTSWLISSIILLVSILVFNMNRANLMEKELVRLREDQNLLLEREYTMLNNAFSINARLFHDFHNHIGILHHMLSHKKNSEALQYVNNLHVPISDSLRLVWTGDETIDYLVNSKASEAAASHIRMEINIEFPKNTNIRATDMCAILGNFLDNALEACQKVTEDSRFIQVALRRINNMLVIKVENSFSDAPSDAPIDTEDGLATTKTEDGIHGWGLKSAKIAAEKYDGIVQTNYDNGVFRAVATLSFDKVMLDK